MDFLEEDTFDEELLDEKEDEDFETHTFTFTLTSFSRRSYPYSGPLKAADRCLIRCNSHCL